MDSIHNPSPSRAAVDLPFWVSVLAGLPVALCMAIMGLPDLVQPFALDFRILYLCTFIFWIFPLAYLQRRLWQSRMSWLAMSVVLLTASYGMSVINNVLGQQLALRLGLTKSIIWWHVFAGLDGCWLAFLAYFALHAVLIYYLALARERMHTADALALARDAQLRALRYQIHPHFLFNTLNAISTLVIHERNREANRMITQLGDFLRATLESEDCHEHALADELALTESYLEIEKARLGNRLEIVTHIGPDVLQAAIPYLLLQPLMENAIRHGIALCSSGGRIDLNIARDDETLQISLKNQLEHKTESPRAHSCGVGLRNIMERLTKLYPERHRCVIERESGRQFSIEIAIPYQVHSKADHSGEPWIRAA